MQQLARKTVVVALSCVVLLEQVTLPVPLAVWKHFGQPDLLEVLDALLQILLQQLPLLLLLILAWRGPTAVLFGRGARQRAQVERGRPLGAVGQGGRGRRQGWRRGGGGVGGS